MLTKTIILSSPPNTLELEKHITQPVNHFYAYRGSTTFIYQSFINEQMIKNHHITLKNTWEDLFDDPWHYILKRQYEPLKHGLENFLVIENDSIVKQYAVLKDSPDFKFTLITTSEHLSLLTRFLTL